MPVIPQISEGIKIGLKMNPAAPPKVVGVITSASEAIMSMSAMLPVSPPIPVIPIGTVVSSALTMIESSIFQSFTQSTQLTNKLINQYNNDYKKAVSQREIAQKTLFQREKDAQDQIKEEIKELEKEINKIEKEISELEKKQAEERSAYMATIFGIKERAKKADKEGRIEERDALIAKVSEFDYWLANIILMTIDIINKRIEVKSKKQELDSKQDLANLKIKNDWSWLSNNATSFNVVIPYYPDLPAPPNLPPTVPIPKESPLPKFLRQIFAKWVTHPMVPPIGLLVSALQMVIQSYTPNTPAPLAAKIESVSDSFILMLGGCY